MSKQQSSSNKKLSPKSIKSKLKKEDPVKSSFSKTSILLLLVLLAYNFRTTLEPYLEPINPYINQIKFKIKPHLEPFLPLTISNKLFPESNNIPEIVRIARELRLSWDLNSAELEVKAAAVEESQKEVEEVVNDKIEVEQEEIKKPVSRSMEELKEIMQDYTADELSQMLDQAYRG